MRVSMDEREQEMREQQQRTHDKRVCAMKEKERE
jgi:hypothetical protein